jgi:hypothetical protein
MCLDGSYAKPQYRRDFRQRHLFGKSQKEDGSLLLGKGGNRSPDRA